MIRLQNQHITPNTTSFLGLRENKLLGERLLKEFYKEFGHMQSSSMLKHKIAKYKKAKRSSYFTTKKMEAKAIKLEKEIYDPKYNNIYAPVAPYKSENEFIKNLNTMLKSLKKANCWEDMAIMSNKLKMAGEKPRLFIIDLLYNNFGHCNHFTCVFGLKKDAKIAEPKTWGNQAVIVDAWSNIVMESKQALEYFYKLFDFNPQKDRQRIQEIQLRNFANIIK